ncbi:hypothetical protein BDV33DRAFT_208036 [Aspergillus novoparasiticus]|uniref:Uncharacterized protein n=1 Tax=Aspergillus novoparasiticus TaxID=986946 RepID=A0A5N6EEJ7_9EURO|nr:hypothetical protein BDV33DRAFT_208036 [Aspergillus novoparasiticus]
MRCNYCLRVGHAERECRRRLRSLNRGLCIIADMNAALPAPPVPRRRSRRSRAARPRAPLPPPGAASDAAADPAPPAGAPPADPQAALHPALGDPAPAGAEPQQGQQQQQQQHQQQQQQQQQHGGLPVSMPNVLVEPQGERLSGICPRLYNKKNINRVPVDPHKARICGLARKGSGNIDFRMAKVAVNNEPDRPRERIRYPIHAHCWVILDRVIGHEIVQKHLREFTRAVEAYWSRNRIYWDSRLGHMGHDTTCRGICSLETCHQWPIYHFSGSPLRIPGILELITQATPECTVELRGHSVIVNPPLDVAILIVDQIYGNRPCSLEMLRDTRNLLEAFQWKLPDTYWRTRFDSRLVFEMDDLIREKRPVNWKEFCLGLEELLLDKDWFCNSGMRIRLRTLTSLGGIKECFLNLVDQQT